MWNGECETVYEDMYGYVTTYAGGRCRKNYELTIIADMNRCVLTFLFHSGSESSCSARIPRKKYAHVFVSRHLSFSFILNIWEYPVIGFGQSKLERWKLVWFTHKE